MDLESAKRLSLLFCVDESRMLTNTVSSRTFSPVWRQLVWYICKNRSKRRASFLGDKIRQNNVKTLILWDFVPTVSCTYE